MLMNENLLIAYQNAPQVFGSRLRSIKCGMEGLYFRVSPVSRRSREGSPFRARGRAGGRPGKKLLSRGAGCVRHCGVR